MKTISTHDLFVRKQKILSEIQALKDDIFGKEKKLELIEEMISEIIPYNDAVHTSPITIEFQSFSPSPRPSVWEKEVKEKIINFLSSQQGQSARTNTITKSLDLNWGKAGQQKVSNALSKLTKEGMIQVVEEVYPDGAVRERNRLYKLMGLVTNAQ